MDELQGRGHLNEPGRSLSGEHAKGENEQGPPDHLATGDELSESHRQVFTPPVDGGKGVFFPREKIVDAVFDRRPDLLLQTEHLTFPRNMLLLGCYSHNVAPPNRNEQPIFIR